MTAHPSHTAIDTSTSIHRNQRGQEHAYNGNGAQDEPRNAPRTTHSVASHAVCTRAAHNSSPQDILSSPSYNTPEDNVPGVLFILK